MISFPSKDDDHVHRPPATQLLTRPARSLCTERSGMATVQERGLDVPTACASRLDPTTRRELMRVRAVVHTAVRNDGDPVARYRQPWCSEDASFDRSTGKNQSVWSRGIRQSAFDLRRAI
jgi:hypothetical protein